MKEIKLTQGQVALVDDEDFEYLNQFKWCAHKNGNVFYAIKTIYVYGKRTKGKMHNIIMGIKFIDHVDNNGLNNQRSNLRACTNSENQMNATKRVKATSLYKGVYYCKKTGKWKSTIQINGNQIYLGYFIYEVDAANAYNKKAIELFGEFANINIISY